MQEEQDNVDTLIAHLDEEVRRANERLDQVMRDVDPNNPDAEALVRRETEYHALNQKIDRLNLAHLGLVFGRIDVDTGSPEHNDHPIPGREHVDRRYIGRLGLIDREDDYRTLLLDWRAPMARPFYLATTAHPEGVEVRRHIRLRGTKVTDVHDEVLSGEASGNASSNVVSEAALHEALQAARTGHMASIVQTIQREQDQIIRDEHRGVMVVEGGPGTGKTAVALHRVAYLLYTWREQLAKTGVLIIGPNPTFLEYISRVLPELGETGVVLSTVGDLYPGVRADVEESLLTREVKGSAEMVVLLERLVKAHQRLPEQARAVSIEGLELELHPSHVKAARTRARRSRRPHNEAREVFSTALAEQLAQLMRERIGADPLGGRNLLGEGDLAELHDDVTASSVFEALVDEFWPELEPTTVLREWLTEPEQIAAIAYDYDEETQEALLATEPGWASSDAALLDELAVLIGGRDVDEQQQAQQQRWREQVAEAAEALDVLIGSQNTDLDDEADAEILSAHDVVDAETLAARQDVRDQRTTAQRAAADRQWAYGHVIIDEAQELTPMEWRMVMRRCPSRWMTLVGDTSQTGSPAGVDAWEDTLAPFVEDRFRTHHLTVNYRTPAQIMEFAHEILQAYAPDAPRAQALRRSPDPVTHLPAEASASEVAAELRQRDPQRLTAVIGPDALASEEIRGVSQCKGLEFDHVVLLHPRAIVEASPQGLQDLYVAATRATQTLTVIGEMPEL